MKKAIILGVMVLMLITSPIEAQPVEGATLNFSKSPKIANMFFRWDITEAEAKQLARWDILIVDMEVQHHGVHILNQLIVLIGLQDTYYKI